MAERDKEGYIWKVGPAAGSRLTPAWLEALDLFLQQQMASPQAKQGVAAPPPPPPPPRRHANGSAALTPESQGWPTSNDGRTFQVMQTSQPGR